MEMRGEIKNLYRDLAGRTIITIETNTDAADIEKLSGDLDISISPHRKKRSLNANSYYHVLCGKIAKVVGTSMTEVCNQMIAEYGQMDKELGAVILKDEINWKKLEGIHVRPSLKTQVMADGKLYRAYWLMRGSHTYDTKEMSDLINGVVEECKQLDIETLPPHELERMLNAWHGNQ